MTNWSRDEITGPVLGSKQFVELSGSRVPQKIGSADRMSDQGCSMRVLMVEDEPRLAENVARSLRESAGYAVDIASNGEEGLFLAESNAYDVMLLDLMLPKMDGMELLRKIRESGQPTPVLVMTARDDKESVVDLLNAGADDYVTKPFDLGELLARTKALIRRGKGQPSPVVVIDATTGQVWPVWAELDRSNDLNSAVSVAFQ